MKTKSRPQYIINIISILYSAICLLPFLLVLSASFTSEYALNENGFKLIPSQFDLTAYEYIFKSPQKILSSYGVTIFVTVATVVGGVLVMSMIGYTLSRSNCKFARPLSFYVFFTLLFSGGMAPSYILMTQVLNWKNTYAVMIVPSLVYAFHVIMIRTFFQKLPPALFESAKIDGANEFVIFFRIALPLSIPVLTTVAFFTAMGKWNDWQTGLLYITEEKMEPLQYMLYRIEQNIQSLLTALSRGGGITVDVRNIPSQNLLMAMAVVAAGPMLVVFPFFQKYFISGLTVGAVKG
jgi:putative aldouronate transport system permease protein